MYSVATTFPEEGSANVGDKLIEQSVKRLIKHEKGEAEFNTFFRETNLDDQLETINKSRALLMPAFAIRDLPLYPNAYALTNDLSDIEVPIIPIGSNYNIYPGDKVCRDNANYSSATVNFLKFLSSQVDDFSCREYHTCRMLENHGINNTVMTGDPAWLDPDKIDSPTHRPDSVERLVFTPPLSAYYVEQAIDLIDMLSSLFPKADKVCSFHLDDKDTKEGESVNPENSAAMSDEVTLKNRRIRQHAVDQGFEIRGAEGKLENLAYYKESDLHVGYECHAHALFIRNRIPSVLITEDARGVGFSYTLGAGGFSGFKRCQTPQKTGMEKSITSGYCTSLNEYSVAPTNTELPEILEQFLEEEVESRFRRFIGLGHIIDDIYNRAMRPFIRELP